MPQKQKVAIEEKVRIVRECLGHKISISEATRIAGVDFETVKLWINKYENEGVCAPEMSKAELIITEKAADDMQIPDHAIRRFARFLLPKIQADLEGTKLSDESTPG